MGIDRTLCLPKNIHGQIFAASSISVIKPAFGDAIQPNDDLPKRLAITLISCPAHPNKLHIAV
jgi:hypothetical protein